MSASSSPAGLFRAEIHTSNDVYRIYDSARRRDELHMADFHTGSGRLIFNPYCGVDLTLSELIELYTFCAGLQRKELLCLKPK
jgi:hypothetical protein